MLVAGNRIRPPPPSTAPRGGMESNVDNVAMRGNRMGTSASKGQWTAPSRELRPPFNGAALPRRRLRDTRNCQAMNPKPPLPRLEERLIKEPLMH